MLFSQATPQLHWYHEWVPLLPVANWWQAGLSLAVFLTLAGVAVWFCRRDTGKLSRPVASTLLLLGVLPLPALLVFFLGPQRHSETGVVQPSELLVLVDTSLSMGLNDDPAAPRQRRIDSVISLFLDNALLQTLNREHRLRVFRFDESKQAEEILSLPRPPTASDPGDLQRRSRTGAPGISPAAPRAIANWLGRGLLMAGIGLLLLAGIARIIGARAATVDRSLCLGILMVVFAAGLCGFADVTSLASEGTGVATTPENSSEIAVNTLQATTLEQVDWSLALAPRGAETRLGDALLDLLSAHRTRATAGILLLTDGRSNQGASLTRAIAAATDASLPVHVLGIGSNDVFRNTRLSDIQVPQKVFPGDRFEIRAVIQSTGLEHQMARVQLLAGGESDSLDQMAVIDEVPLQLGADSEPRSIAFPIASQSEGSRSYAVRILPVAGELDSSDNVRRATAQIETRRTRVLLIAGGPMRDYQFLRNQLYRDADIELDVWLQLTQPGADQEADQLLFAFPESAEALFEYDCIVAFDPDWRKLTAQQSTWLERWVSERAGGMIVVAGPVNTPEWTRQPRGDEAMDPIRQLYPVSFYSQGSAALKLGRFGGTRPFPLEFTREGLTADFLQLADTLPESVLAWKSFDGVFGYYAVNETRRGADVLARFSDPDTQIDGQQPVWLASHLYGAGRVVFQASGEIWRLREAKVEYFQRYYLNLIRWASQGRLLRDSQQGVLLVDRNRCWVGDPVVVRAIIHDPAGNPLLSDSVQATVVQPDGVARPVTLDRDRNAATPGSYSGQFRTRDEGLFQIRFPLPGDRGGHELRAEIESRIPDLEKVQPQRDDATLQLIADRTGGCYFYDLGADGRASLAPPPTDDSPDSGSPPRIDVSGSAGLAALIGVADQELRLPGSRDLGFSRRLAAWLIGWLVLVLCCRWSLRRMYRLA
jgi:hypothetical protein